MPIPIPKFVESYFYFRNSPSCAGAHPMTHENGSLPPFPLRMARGRERDRSRDRLLSDRHTLPTTITTTITTTTTKFVEAVIFGTVGTGIHDFLFSNHR
jgi:hypothetical protein